MSLKKDFTDNEAEQTPKIAFIKSSYCASGSCVEVATHNGQILLRDGKKPNQEPLVFEEQEWTAFVKGIKNNEFNHN